ncbi:MAG: proteasome accessory factor PafA2 family protein [Micropruina glycogenica]
MTPQRARRVFGVETEYGLVGRRAGARGTRLSGGEAAQWLFTPIEREHASSNVFLRNGGRLYLDVGSHPEYATAECATVDDLLVHERAGDELVARLARRAEADAAEQGEPVWLRLFKNNVDSHGNSYGCHENYLIDRALDLPALATVLTPFLVTRQVVCGSGRWSPDGFSISQRAEVLHDELSSMTTRSRPLINTRDEPLADPRRFRRLHVISGDSNLSEPSAALKVGSLLAVLAAIEAALAEGRAVPALELDDVAGALRGGARPQVECCGWPRAAPSGRSTCRPNTWPWPAPPRSSARGSGYSPSPRAATTTSTARSSGSPSVP